MKNSKFLKHLGKLSLSLVGLVIAACMLEPDLIHYALEAFGVAGVSGSGGTVMAMAIVSGTGGSGADTRESAKTLKPDSAEKPGHLANEVSKLVTIMAPDEAPIDTLLRQVDSEENTDDIQVNFEEVEIRGRQLTINGEFTAAGTTTDADKYVTLTFDSTANVVPGEVLMTRTVNGANSKPLQIRVDSKISSTQLKAYPLNVANDAMPTIADDTVFYRIAPAAGEMAAQAPGVSQYPDMRYNWCQRYTAQVEETFIRKKVKANSSWDFNDQNYLRMYDMKNSLESSSLFGQMSKKWSAEEGEWIYTQEGIFYQLDQELEYAGSDLTNSKWIDWTKAIFADNAGSDERYLWAGSSLMAEILKIPSVEKQQEAMNVEVIAGVRLHKVETSFGILYVKFHKMFDQMGHADEGLVLDMNNIKRRTFQSLKSEKLKLKEAGVRNVDAQFISEISCLETRYLDTHRRIVKTA